MSLAAGKVLLHLAARRHRVVDASDIYYVEAQGDETDMRLRAAGRVRDHAVNPGRVLEIRAGSGSLREVRLELPVNAVLPVSRGSLASLLAAYRPDPARAARSRRPQRR